MTLSVSDLAEELRKEYADTPVAANQLVGMLRTLIAFGIPGGYIDRNPAIEVKPLEILDVQTARPWPEGSQVQPLIIEHRPLRVPVAVEFDDMDFCHLTHTSVRRRHPEQPRGDVPVSSLYTVYTCTTIDRGYHCLPVRSHRSALQKKAKEVFVQGRRMRARLHDSSGKP